MRKIAAILAFTALFASAFGQETTTKKTTRPDIPGTFTLELGVNSASGAPNRFDLGFWGSRSLNVYYQYDIRILKSKFSFVPGIGFSLERFKFKNGYSLGYSGDSLAMLSPTQRNAEYPGIKKSMLVTNYIEVPLEICFRSNPEDPARSFKASVGGRIGYMLDSFNKIKYRENGETKKIKDKQDFQLNKIRYGIYGKIGVGNFSVFTYYNLSPLFESGKGPVEKKVKTEFSTMTIGISLSSF
jgi:hypothetical protein